MPYDSPVTRKVMVVGSGGREHALALALLDSPSVDEVVVCPGNAGTEGGGLRNAVGTPLGVAQAEAPALVVVGPEAPLCEGLVDDLAGRGILAFGPSREAARLEGSKSFMKSFAKRHGLPTARHIVLERVEDVAGAAREFALPPVVKADGLCAGKGVVVSQTHDEAIEAARGMLSGQSFGEAGLRVVMEERLEGVEASVHAICDGERALVLPAAQDHKRIGDGDTGPNTGGMGSYAPTPLVSPALMDRVREQIVLPAVRGMAADGHPYRGALFAGLMISPSGEPRLLEFNVRFGDPETQVLMAILRGDLAEALASAARGHLDETQVSITDEHAVCVVLAAAGYPGTPRRGDAITGVERAEQVPGVRVIHAGTARFDGALRTAGGRVLGVTARGDSLAQAHERAYLAADAIEFEGKQLRRDIAARALG
ncbi:MAG: phosphoribosylamine--glycine ligase [Myxococcales bacterium]|nr:phosphoribosylamine--glycine ligase [Myxococcales bacterium]MCB9577159.1 phosphoribosylamine--glycine ligase [Polyangiaceae bacterium]